MNYNTASIKEKDYIFIYDHIAKHFNETRKAIWKCVGKFLDNIPKYCLIADIGCGNGKYTCYRQDIFVIANDICVPLLNTIEKAIHMIVVLRMGCIYHIKIKVFNMLFL